MTDPSLYSSLDVILEYDDGAVVYLNGVELFRANLPTGTIAYSTLASTSLEDTLVVYPINPSALVTGTNVLAVEVHQESSSSNDCHFELRMIANQVTGQSVWRKYYYAGGARVAMREGITSTGTTGLSFLLGDHLGSTNVTTNAIGQQVSELRYKPWGQVRYSLGTSQTTFRFTGQRDNLKVTGEAALDMYYYGARWYEPYLNHFTQPDTIIPDPSNPQSWNRYAYVNNNPINFNDPSGHVEWCSEITGNGVCDTERKQALFYRRVDVINEQYKGKDDLKAMVYTTRAAAQYFHEDPDLMMLTLNELFLGTSTIGPLSMWNAHKTGLDTGYLDTGFYDEYLDKSNQVRHFWAALASSVQPNTTIISLAGKDPLSVILMSGIVTEMSALVHELDPRANGSYQDFFLSTMGNQIGLRLSLGLINPLELATVIDTTVGPNAFFTPNDTWRIGYINPFFLP